MPYIKPHRRPEINEHIDAAAEAIHNHPGELNYAITRLITAWELDKHRLGRSTWSYSSMNEVIGVLECVKQEYIRRELNPYEEEKLDENGDIFDDNENEEESQRGGLVAALGAAGTPRIGYGEVRKAERRGTRGALE